MHVDDFVPDRNYVVETKEDFEKEHGFEWDGPGIYLKNGSALVVVPTKEYSESVRHQWDPWSEKQKKGPFHVFVWNRDPFSAMKAIVGSAPTRRNVRDKKFKVNDLVQVRSDPREIMTITGMEVHGAENWYEVTYFSIDENQSRQKWFKENHLIEFQYKFEVRKVVLTSLDDRHVTIRDRRIDLGPPGVRARYYVECKETHDRFWIDEKELFPT